MQKDELTMQWWCMISHSVRNVLWHSQPTKITVDVHLHVVIFNFLSCFCANTFSNIFPVAQSKLLNTVNQLLLF